MEEFDFARNITIGQYLAVDSFVHKMDPRVKLLCFTALIGAISFSMSYIAHAILFVTALGLVALSRIPVRYALTGLKPAIPFVTFLVVLQILLYSPTVATGAGCATYLHWMFINVNSCGIQVAVVSVARFVDLLILGSLLTFSTTITELTLGTEGLLSPLKRYFSFPAHELALTLTIALRFVPTFAEELERIIKAQVSRGADLGQKGRWRFIEQTRAILPLTVPLFLSALRRAEDLILAMEARCYVGGKGRTHYVEFRSKPSDFVALGLVIAFSAAVLFFPFPL